MTELVEHFDDRIDQPYIKEILRSQDAIDEVLSQVGPVRTGKDQGCGHRSEPDSEANPAK